MACECPAFPGVYRGGAGAAPAGATAQTARVTRLRYATGSSARRRCAQRRHARQPAPPRQAGQGTPGGGGGGRSERTARPRVGARAP